MADIRPNQLPAASSVNPASAIIVDAGGPVEKATPLQVVDAAIPLASQAEAEAGTDNEKRVTPLRVKQAIDEIGVSKTDLSSTDSDKGVALVAGSARPVPNRTAMAALDGTTFPTALLNENGSRGTFRWVASDLSSAVAIDTDEALFVPPAGGDGTTGAWVREWDGPASVEWFGASGDGITDDTASIAAAAETLSQLADNVDLGNWNNFAFLQVGFQGGRNYKIDSTIVVPNAYQRIHFVGVGGVANLVGDAGKTYDGINLRCRSAIFRNLTFTGFDTAAKFDTGNVDTSLIRFIDCEWSDSNVGVDSTSYAASRSTVLVFERPKIGGGVTQFLRTFCDMTVINDMHGRNFAENTAFIFADSQLIINGGVLTPYVAGATGRWIDLDNTESGAIGRNSVTINGTRFGPESDGGIPVVYSNIPGATGSSVRTTVAHIALNDVYAGSNNATTPQGIIVLRDNAGGTESVWPNSISVRGGSLNAASGLVVTESGLPVTADVGQFVIDIDEAAQVQFGSTTLASSRPLVEAKLEKYVSHWRINETIITDTGSITVSVGGRDVIWINPPSATTITDFTDAMAGKILTVVFQNANTTINNTTNGGPVLFKNGSDYTSTAYSSIRIVRQRSASRWIEV